MNREGQILELGTFENSITLYVELESSISIRVVQVNGPCSSKPFNHKQLNTTIQKHDTINYPKPEISSIFIVNINNRTNNINGSITVVKINTRTKTTMKSLFLSLD